MLHSTESMAPRRHGFREVAVGSLGNHGVQAVLVSVHGASPLRHQIAARCRSHFAWLFHGTRRARRTRAATEFTRASSISASVMTSNSDPSWSSTNPLNSDSQRTHTRILMALRMHVSIRVRVSSRPSSSRTQTRLLPWCARGRLRAWRSWRESGAKPLGLNKQV